METPGASVEWVRFYGNGTLGATLTSPPYLFTANDVTVGTYVLTTRVRDSLGREAVSAPVTVTVTSGGGNPDPPTVELVEPSTGSTYDAPANIPLAAEATAPGANILRVRFLNGSQVIGTVTSAPYTMTWGGAGAGVYTLRARVEDSLGRTATSAPVAVTVTDNTPPPGAQQTLSLGTGWNLVSSNVAPSDSAMAEVLSDVLDEVVIVQDEAGNVFLPSDDVNTIGYWRTGEAYQLYLMEPATLTIVGEGIAPEQTPIVIGQEAPGGTVSWSQVAFLRTTPMDVGEALESVASELVVVKDNYGRVYMPHIDIDQIGQLQPGQGYKMYASAEATLLYPANGGALTGIAAGRSDKGGGAVEESADRPFAGSLGSLYKESATLIVEADSTFEGAAVEVSDSGGELVSAAEFQRGRAILTLYGGDPSFPGRAAVTPGEVMSLSVRTADGGTMGGPAFGEIRDLLRGVTVDAPLAFVPDAVYGITLLRPSLPQGETLVQTYPNPFTTRSTISYQLIRSQHVELQIFDVMGRLVRSLVDTEQGPGTHHVVVDASGLASGVYYCNLRAGEETLVRSMTLVR